MKTPVSTSKAPSAIGPYSQGIVSGQLVFVSGQLPINPANGEIPATVNEQAEQALANLAAVLEAAGSEMAKVVKVTVFLTDIKDFAAVNAIYKRVFDVGAPFPARSAVQVSALPRSEALLEIEAIAAL